MEIGGRVKFETNGGWYNSGIVVSMNEKTCVVEVDTLGNPDSIVPLPYYVSGSRSDFITECECRANTLEQYLAPHPSYCERKREVKNMTNFEWLVKNKTELVKGILAQHLSKEKGIPKRCSDIDCRDCDFDWNSNSLKDCRINTEKWLEKEREPLYKKGDIVIDTYSKILVVTEDDCGEDVIKVSRYINDLEDHQYIIPITEIKKKVGHIESEPSLCASCKSKECILQTGVVREHCDFYKAESEV